LARFPRFNKKHLKLGWSAGGVLCISNWDCNRKPPETPSPAEPRAFLPVQLPHREDAFELREDLGNLGYRQNMSEHLTTSDVAFGLYIYTCVLRAEIYIYIIYIMYDAICICNGGYVPRRTSI
jgi:hypothetical protein